MSDAPGGALHIFQQIAAALRSRILAGELAPGANMPTQAEVAAEFSVATLTARAALQVLRDEGLIVSRRGARSYVADRTVVAPAAATPLIRVHRHKPILAIRWPQLDRWLMVWPHEDAGDGEPAAATEWRPLSLDVDGDDWVDPTAAPPVDVSPYTGRVREQLAAAAKQLRLVGESLDELESHPWND